MPAPIKTAYPRAARVERVLDSTISSPVRHRFAPISPTEIPLQSNLHRPLHPPSVLTCPKRGKFRRQQECDQELFPFTQRVQSKFLFFLRMLSLILVSVFPDLIVFRLATVLRRRWHVNYHISNLEREIILLHTHSLPLVNDRKFTEYESVFLLWGRQKRTKVAFLNPVKASPKQRFGWRLVSGTSLQWLFGRF